MQLCTVIAIAQVACARAPIAETNPASGRVVPVLATTVATRDVPLFFDGLGTVTAYKTINVHTQVDGQLMDVHFREGQRVRKGDLLAQIDPRPFLAQLHQAEGALERDNALLADSKLNLARYINLLSRKLIPQSNVDDQQATVGQYQGATRIDRAQIETARLNLTYARLVAPVDGVTGIRLVDPGNLVHAADQNGIVVLTQIDPIAILFSLPQEDLAEVFDQMKQAPLPVELYTRDGGRHLGTARLALVDNQINQTTATLRLKAIAANPDRRLWPNQFVKARLLVATRKGATVVPAAVIQRGPAGTFAYVIGAGQVASVRPVVVDRSEGDSRSCAPAYARAKRWCSRARTS